MRDNIGEQTMAGLSSIAGGDGGIADHVTKDKTTMNSLPKKHYGSDLKDGSNEVRPMRG